MKYATSQKGFSLVETLVAITILLLVIIGPLTISTSSVKSTSFASEQVAAFFLAQEGAELAEKARDDLVLEHFDNQASRPTPWADFINTANGPYRHCYGPNGCGLSISTDSVGTLSTVRQCSALSNCALYLDTTTAILRSRYSHVSTTGTASPYSRTVRFTRVSASEVGVVSTVTWRSGFSRDEQRVVVQTSLFNVYGTN